MPYYKQSMFSSFRIELKPLKTEYKEMTFRAGQPLPESMGNHQHYLYF